MNDDDVTARRRGTRKRANRTTLAVAGAACVAVSLLGFCGLGAAVTAVAARRANEVARPAVPEPKRHVAGDWTYNELLAFLKSRGRFSQSRTVKGDVYFFEDSCDDLPLLGAEFEMLIDNGYRPAYRGVAARVTRCESEDAARQLAGRVQDGRWSWGRWAFASDDEGLAKLRAALE